MLVGVPFGIPRRRALWEPVRHTDQRRVRTEPPADAKAWSGVSCWANLVAAVPGRIAALTPTAVVLRTE